MHALLLQIHFQGHLKTLTERKIFGAYYHSLIRHASQQYRLFCGRTINAEKEEATFYGLKTSANLTFNHQPDHVI